MNTYEAFLRKEGILLLFLKNYKNKHNLPHVDINSAFTWSRTPQGQAFWLGYHNLSDDSEGISAERVNQLRYMLLLAPPRYKEVV